MSNLEYYYIKGQKDGSKGIYAPPHRKFGGGWLNNYTQREFDEIEAYNKGYQNAKNQR